MGIIKILLHAIFFMFFFGIVYSWYQNGVFPPIGLVAAWIVFIGAVIGDITFNIYKMMRSDKV
ncbi:MAG: hypothetical protein ACFFCI_04765 [Promethearchaeota archaeon]